MGPDPTDAEVIRRSLTDADAFVAVFERHFDPICGYLARRVGADSGSQIASEVFVTAFAGRGRYDLTRPDARPWLYGIAANLLRRHHRAETRELRAYARVGIDAPREFDATGKPDPGLAAALAALKPADRETLLLFAWADLDYTQIAEALHVPVGTVRSRLNRARRHLRDTLVDDDSVVVIEEAAHG